MLAVIRAVVVAALTALVVVGLGLLADVAVVDRGSEVEPAGSPPRSAVPARSAGSARSSAGMDGPSGGVSSGVFGGGTGDDSAAVVR
jgi:hypothetical protein